MHALKESVLAPYSAIFHGPIGPLGIRIERGAVTALELLSDDFPRVSPRDPLTCEVVRQLQRYFEDPAFRFDLPLRAVGTPFQGRVWAAMSAIPSGSTRTYGDLAAELQTGARAVGGACRANPLPIVVPCHRVVAAHGPGGYTGHVTGIPLHAKLWLLRHEGATLSR